MNVHHVHPETGEYLASASARLDPRATTVAGEPRWLVPRHATLQEPPATSEGEAAVWDRQAQSWSVVADHRGETVYATEDGRARVIDALGPLPGGVTTEPRPSPHHAWDDGAWVEDVEAARAAGAARVVGLAAEICARALRAYPEGERLSWEIKARAASKIAAEETLDAAEQALMGAETAETAETPAEWAAGVAAKVAPFAALAGGIAGIRRRAVAAIEEAEDGPAVAAIADAADADLEAVWAAFVGT